MLAQHPSDASQALENIVWQGQEWTLQEAWLRVAKLLVGAGCDPRLGDYRATLPHHLATLAGNHKLAEFLSQVG